MVEQAEGLKLEHDCDKVVAQSAGSWKLECEVWLQVGSGSHLYVFNVHYTLLSIFHISDGTSEGKTHSVLVNAFGQHTSKFWRS